MTNECLNSTRSRLKAATLWEEDSRTFLKPLRAPFLVKEGLLGPKYVVLSVGNVVLNSTVVYKLSPAGWPMDRPSVVQVKCLHLCFDIVQHGDVRIRAAVYRSAPFCSEICEDGTLLLKRPEVVAAVSSRGLGTFFQFLTKGQMEEYFAGRDSATVSLCFENEGDLVDPSDCPAELVGDISLAVGDDVVEGAGALRTEVVRLGECVPGDGCLTKIHVDVSLDEELDFLDGRFEKGLEVFLGFETVGDEDEFRSKLGVGSLTVRFS